MRLLLLCSSLGIAAGRPSLRRKPFPTETWGCQYESDRDGPAAAWPEDASRAARLCRKFVCSAIISNSSLSAYKLGSSVSVVHVPFE